MAVSGDDLPLWSAALTGDQRAFGQVFDRHYDRVFRHAFSLSEQRADADEVTGAAFLELWRLRARVHLINGSVLPWLLVTAGNLARNHGRRTHRYRDVLRRLPREDDQVDASEVVADRDLGRRRAVALSRALDRLSPIDAQLVALTMHEELSIVEAATAVGLTAGAARVRLHRARARLRSWIELPEFEPIEEGEAR